MERLAEALARLLADYWRRRELEGEQPNVHEDPNPVPATTRSSEGGRR
jgi:hypothetical protein